MDFNTPRIHYTIRPNRYCCVLNVAPFLQGGQPGDLYQNPCNTPIPTCKKGHFVLLVQDI